MTSDRFVSPCPPPSDYQRELLDILIEEASEVIQRATKALRFGIDEVQPGQPNTNAWRLGLEVGDFQAMVDRCVSAGIIEAAAIEAGQINKHHQLAKFMQTEPADDR